MPQRRVLCLDCGKELTESSDLSLRQGSPCPDCGSLARKIIVELSEQIYVSSSVSGELTTEAGQVVRVGTAREKEFAQPIEPRRAIPFEELPSEVIAESLQAQVTLLPPEPGDNNEQWLGEVEVWGHTGPIVVGELPDSLIEIAQWLEKLGQQWQQQRSDESDS